MKEFLEKIKAFNDHYGYSLFDTPTLPIKDNLENFKKILQEELNEIDAIIEMRAKLETVPLAAQAEFIELYRRCLVDLADWYGDMIIFCHTSARRYGLPMDKVLDAIMQSNMTKLGADGKPIYDERGKIMKGPNFVAPETMIEKVLNF